MTFLPLLPPPGIVKDDSTFASEGRWADSDGFRFEQGRPVTIGGAVEMTSATEVLSANKMLVYEVSGTIQLAVAGETLRTGAINAAGTDITPASGWAGAGRHSLAMFGDVLLASENSATLFESVAGAQATAITNAPDDITTFVVTPSRQVMALGCNEEGSGTFNGRCVRWCDIEDTTDWTTTSTNNAGEYILPGQADIVGGTVLGDYILIWTEAALWVARFVGDPSETFTFERVATVGLIGQDAHAILRQTVYWLSPDKGFHAYTVGGLVERLTCPISTLLDNNLNQAGERANAFACANSRHGEVWFSLTLGTSNPLSYVVFCVDESVRAQRPVWFSGNYATIVGITAVGAMVDSPLPWDGGTNDTSVIVHELSSSGTADPRPWRWDCTRTAASVPLGISGSYIQSADMYLDNSERRAMVRSFIADFDTQSGAVSLTLFMRDRPMEPAVTKGPYTVATSTDLATALVNDTVASGDDEMDIDTNPEQMAAGVTFTVSGVNAYVGGDTGSLMVFTVAEDFIGGDGTLHFTPAAINTGAGRNVVNLPANNAVVSALTRKGKKDFRASGKIMAAKITTLGAFRVRFGKPLFDVVPLGLR
jgi:hypothetical protein